MFYTEPVVTVLARPSFREPSHLPVSWVGESSDGERLAEFAGRICYMSQHNPAQRTTEAYLENIKKQGHGSVLEHANYTLLLEGVSRSLTHELVRHRAGFAYCLAGDTRVYSEHRNRGKRDGARKRPIRQLFEMTRTPHGRSRLKLLRLRCLDESTGTFTTGEVADVAFSGRKPVFRVALEDGKTITCTKEHRFLTPGGWQSLEDAVGGLSVSPGGIAVTGQLDAHLMVNGVEAYRDAGWLHGRSGESLARTATAAQFDPPSTLAPTERARSVRMVRVLIPHPRRIVSVTYAGEQDTYDIEMAGPNHNFVAEGIVTHNSQLSQRYVDESEANFVVPPAIVGDGPLETAWRTQVEGAQAAYVALVETLMERYAWVGDKVHRRKMAREAARGVLPNSTETKIVVTGNARAWRTMLELRAGEGAELEIRRLAVAVLRVLVAEAPAFFSDFEVYQAGDRREAARVGFHKV